MKREIGQESKGIRTARKIYGVLALGLTLTAYQNCSQSGQLAMAPTVNQIGQGADGSISRPGSDLSSAPVVDSGSAPLFLMPPPAVPQEIPPQAKQEDPIIKLDPPQDPSAGPHIVSGPPPANPSPAELPTVNPDVPQEQLPPQDPCAGVKVEDLSIQFDHVVFQCEKRVRIKHEDQRWHNEKSQSEKEKKDKDYVVVKDTCHAEVVAGSFSRDNNQVRIRVQEDVELNDGEMILQYSGLGHQAMNQNSEIMEIKSKGRPNEGLRFKVKGKHHLKAGKEHSCHIDIDIVQGASKCMVQPVVKNVKFDDGDDENDQDHDDKKEHSKDAHEDEHRESNHS